MRKKTVVLWGQDDLLSSSVELFLTTQKGWNVVNISIEHTLDVLLKAVDKVHPDVVILEQGVHASNPCVPTTLLKHHPRLKVITLNPDNNLMEVFSKQNILLKSAADLIAAVEANPVIQTSNNQPKGMLQSKE